MRILRVSFDKRVFIVSDAPIARVKDDPGPAPQLIGERQRHKSLHERYGGGIGL